MRASLHLLCILFIAIVALLWICSKLVVEPSCQLERERAFRAEQLVLRLQARGQPEDSGQDQSLLLRIQSLEKSLNDERAKNSGGGGFQGALVSSLKEENQILQSKNSELRAQLDRLSRNDNPQNSPLFARGRNPPAASISQMTGGEMVSRPEPLTEERLRTLASQDATAVAVITCKRPRYLERAMASYLQVRGSAQANAFPIIISQDAHDPTMTNLVETKYVAEGVAYHMHHEHDPNADTIARRFGKNAKGYVLIAQHYGFVMRRLFDDFGFKQVIFLEEDMEVSPDFFSYFSAMLPILRADPQLFCVSAWNDNGYSTLAQDSRAVFRTEFFPGLGWMMDQRMWGEVRDRWAVAFWDEFMRRPDVRRGRHCIRPEVSRSFTFGEQGVSAGQFFKTHLSRIHLNDDPVDWAAQDLSSLGSPELFEAHLARELRQATRIDLSEADVRAGPGVTLRIEYDDKRDFKRVATKFGLMPDEKEGVRRGAYRGVIPFTWRGGRVYLYTRNWPSDLY